MSDFQPSDRLAPVQLQSLDHLPVTVCLLNGSGVIIGVNERWERFAAANKLDDAQFGVGLDYLAECRRALGEAHQLVRDLAALLAHRTTIVTWTYPCRHPHGTSWFTLIGVPAQAAGVAAVLLHLDISGLVPEDAGVGGPSPDTARAALLPQPVPLARTDADGPLGPASADRETQRWVDTRLTGRQLEVFRLLGRGLENDEIARGLGLSANTVKLHVSAIVARLGLPSRTRVALLAAALARHPGRSFLP